MRADCVGAIQRQTGIETSATYLGRATAFGTSEGVSMMLGEHGLTVDLVLQMTKP